MNEITVKTILNPKKKRDPWFLDDYTLNPYSGCSFNCLYCYIRGSKYGIHMERKLGVKVNAPELLAKALEKRGKKGQYGIIVLSSATDPYLQLEKEIQLTRKLLEIILDFKFPVHIITKSDLVTRDFDLLHQIDKEAILPKDLQPKIQRGTVITFSFATVDDHIAHIFEPGATTPSVRLMTMKTCANAGFLTGVSMMPLLPWISDTAAHLELMYESFQSYQANYVFPAHLTLFGNEPSSSKTLVLHAVKKYYPELIPTYEKLFKDSDDMPHYYKKAFYKKMETLHRKYGIRNRIINNSV